MNRTAMTLGAVVLMIAMGSFLALTPAYYVMQAHLSGYRYHEWLSACRAAPDGASYREGYVYDDSGALAARVARNNPGDARIELSAPTWNVYRYQTRDLHDCDNGDSLYLAKKIGLPVKEK
jgi:hypothetical protein